MVYMVNNNIKIYIVIGTKLHIVNSLQDYPGIMQEGVIVVKLMNIIREPERFHQ